MSQGGILGIADRHDGVKYANNGDLLLTQDCTRGKVDAIVNGDHDAFGTVRRWWNKLPGIDWKFGPSAHTAYRVTKMSTMFGDNVIGSKTTYNAPVTIVNSDKKTDKKKKEKDGETQRAGLFTILGVTAPLHGPHLLPLPCSWPPQAQ